MLNYRFIGLLICLFAVQAAFGQTYVVVTEQETGLGLPQAHVLFTSLQGSEKHAMLSNNAGEAILSADQGLLAEKWAVEVSYVGFVTLRDTVDRGSRTEFKLLPSLATLGEMVVTAQYAPVKTDDAVHIVRVIDAKKIEQMAAVSLEDVLSNELNIRLAQDNVLGSSMSMQGLSGQNVKIMIDGVPIIGRQDGNLDLSQINLQNIERIEIVEGPLSVNYGTDALAGTINLITRKKQSGRWSVDANYYQESIGTYNWSSAARFRIKGFQVAFTGGRNFFDGWHPNDEPGIQPPDRTANESRVQSWKPREQYFGSAQLNWSRKHLKLGYQLRFFDETITNRGLPRAPYQETAFDDRYFTTRVDQALTFAGKIAPKLTYQGVAGYSDYERKKNSFVTQLTTLEETLSESSGSQDTARFGLWMSRGSVAFSPDSLRLQMELGYDVQYETAFGQRIENQNQEQGDFALFSTAEWTPFKALTLRPGVRVAHNTRYDAPIVPSFNLKYSYSNWTLRASYARGFRAPTLKELYFFFVDVNHNIQGNDALKAENSNNYAVNLQHRYLLGKSLFRVELGGFYNQIENLISLAQVNESLFSYVNIGRYRTKGGKLQTTWIYPGWKLQLGASYTGQYNQLSEENDISNFSYSPEGNASLTKEIKPINTKVSFFYKYQGELPGFSLNSEGSVINTSTEAYHMADLTASRRFWKSRLGLATGVKNLLDIQNVNTVRSGGVHSGSSNSVPVSTGRLYFIKLDFKWNQS